MEVIEITKKMLKNGRFNYFPKGHMVAISLLGISLAGFTIFPSNNASATRRSEVIEIPVFDPELSASASIIDIEDQFEEDIETDHLVSNVQTVKSGDNLSKIFKRAGLTDTHMMNLLSGSKESKRLADLYPGHTISFHIDPNTHTLETLVYTQSELKSYSFTRDGKSYAFEDVARTPDIKLAHSAGTIEHSLYGAGTEARMSEKLIMELADIFGWDIDFALDIRKGDSFKVIYEEKFLDGEKIGNGSIVAAEFTNQGDVFKAVRYINKAGDTSYFTPKGESMRKAFLRAPLDFRRISSNFNPRRLHPIYKTVRAHRGTDYAADRGTPVWASGNGRVLKSGYTKANGNYVVIQHGNNIQTKYLHLHKRHVKAGQKVKQKQKIGTVGSTGYSTAPHLHYEFLISGVHRNPRTIVNKLPKAKSIDKSELERFQQQTQPLMAELDRSAQAIQYATADVNNSTDKL